MRRRFSPARLAVGGLVAALLGVQAIRVAAVGGLGGERFADLVWQENTRASLSRGLVTIGTLAGQGKAPPPALLATFREGASRDPLAPEPYLVAGTEALNAGRPRRAGELLRIAVRNDPRNVAARFLLAQIALQGGDIDMALRHIAVVAQFVPSGAVSLAPALASFATQPGAEGKLRPALRRDPSLANAVLEQLAANPANVELILRLAPPPSDGIPPPWQGRLLNTLIDAGQAAEARRLWARFVGQSDTNFAGVADPDFHGRPLPPPFAWTLSSGAEGSAEPDGHGALQILYYGRNDTSLASQILTLPPGLRSFSVRVIGEEAGDALAWTLTCVENGKVLMRLPMRGTGTRELTAPLNIPSACPAQRLSIMGSASDTATTRSVSVSRIRIGAVDG